MASSRARASSSARTGSGVLGRQARQGFGEDRDRVVGQDLQVLHIEAGPAVRRHERRIDGAGHVALGDEGRRGQRVERRPARPARWPPWRARASGSGPRQEQRAEHDQGHGQGRDRDRHVQPQLGPAVGVLVQPEAHGRRDEDGDGQGHQGEGQGQVHLRPPDDGQVQPDEDAAGQAGRGHELEVAAPRVVGVGHPDGRQRVQTAEQVADLEADEERGHAGHRHAAR